MTDRHSAYLVTLAKDIREDDAEEGILTALRMLKGVIDVRPVTAQFSSDAIRRDAEWTSALLNLTDRMRSERTQ